MLKLFYAVNADLAMPAAFIVWMLITTAEMVSR